ncbi:hypothetical protein [Clostridium tetani]|uniref:Uncharacterized protein n=1 Tax=Clostridium tetani TaxID=1513 RepID=A0ABY0EML6_CLOTA|nr:hypothetical protein [Clostridium tetani]CDI49179.1 hypothetical protein BN906_01172 [Clostridium tetani 12124569]AVP54532.1 hypothetical protein C3B72_05095 [Clostridium tetani]KHO39518.1 hypothetical protein OR62_05580 [Clostridium tetani]RXI52675.1 hypothetical protein DP131_12220 [Clostridium tetani]RXI68597.1 hypothetical protein DQN76_10085 [Clostridium tetani]
MSSFNYKVPGDHLQQDLINNTIPQTVWQKIYLHLKKLGYEVYSPGQKRDKCIDSYVVIKENGTYATNGNVTGYKLFDIIIYHPMSNYTSMEFYVENIKQAMKDIGELRPTGNETPSIIDEKIEAYTASIEYQQFKSLRR